MRLNKNGKIQSLKLWKEMVWLDAHCSFCVGYLALSFLCTSGDEKVILMYYHCLFPF